MIRTAQSSNLKKAKHKLEQEKRQHKKSMQRDKQVRAAYVYCAEHDKQVRAAYVYCAEHDKQIRGAYVSCYVLSMTNKSELLMRLVLSMTNKSELLMCLVLSMTNNSGDLLLDIDDNLVDLNDNCSSLSFEPFRFTDNKPYTGYFVTDQADPDGNFYKHLDLTRFNKIAIQGTPQMAVDKEAICLSRVYSYYPKCNFPLFYV